MCEYSIMTDSCCDLSAEMVEELELTVLPLSLMIEDRVLRNYPDNRELDPKDFYDKLRGGVLGSTSAVNVGEFQTEMERIAASGQDILCISFSSGLSTTYQSACIAARTVMAEHEGCTIKVIDSLGASMGQGLLVYLAAREKRKGKSLEEVFRFVEQTRERICHWFTVDDLFHLKRGGRLSAAKAVVGSMLNMKPILIVDETGHLTNTETVRGRKASIATLLKKMDEQVEDPSVVFISHGDCLEDAHTLERMIQEKYPVETVVINYVGPVIGNHSGPGTLAVFFQGKRR